MKRALILGGNGFIGSHLTDELLRLEWDVTVLDFQNRRFDSMPSSVHFIHGSHTQAYLVREALAGVDTVFHLAWATIHEVSNEDPAADVVANLVPSIHLLEACRQQSVRRIIFTSSGGTVYGPAREWPITETHPKNPINAYGITKLAVEKYLEMFHHLYGLDYAILRPSVPYGPRQNPLGRQGAAAVFLYRVARGLPITIWGDGSVSRDYFYVSDLVRALIAASERDPGGNRIFNIGGSEEISLNCLVEQVEKTVGMKAIVEYQPDRKFDASRILLDTSAARDHLGWQAEVALDEGLRRTWDWMATNFDFTEHTPTNN